MPAAVIASKLKSHCRRFRSPSREHAVELCFLLGAPGPKRGELHAFRRLVAMGLRGFLNRLPAFRESAFDVPWNGGDAKFVVVPFERVAHSFKFAAERPLVDAASLLLRFVKFAADNGAPASVATGCQVEDEAVRVELGVQFAARVVIEVRDQKACRLFRDRAAATATR